MTALAISLRSRSLELPNVRAQAFTLVDDNGVEWGRFGWSEEGDEGPLLSVQHPAAGWVMSFGMVTDVAGQTFPALLVGDANRTLRTTLAAGKQGAWLHMNDSAGTRRLSLGVVGGAGPYVQLMAENGRVLFQRP